MTKVGLITLLKSLGISEDDYSINEGLKPDSYVLDSSLEFWKCSYVDERGGESLLEILKTEQEAFQFLLERLINDYSLES